MLLAALVPLAGPPPAGAGWTAPVAAVAPRPADLAPLQLAAAPGGRVAIGFGEADGDDPTTARALLVTGRAGGRFGAVRSIPGSQLVLAAAYLGSRLVVLTGSAAPGHNCCETVAAASPVRGGVPGGQLILAGARGPVQAALVPDGTRLLAVIASEEGVWAARSGPRGERFGRPERVSAADQFVQSMSAAPAAGGAAEIVWSAATGSPVAAGPTELLVARAAGGRLPGPGRPLLRVPATRSVDELALVPGAAPTIAWVQSGLTRGGRFDSAVWTSPITGRVRARRLSSHGVLAGGLTAAGRTTAPQVLSWRGCGGSGACVAQAAVGPAGGRGSVGPVRTLGPMQPGEQPAATLTGAGQPLVAWVAGDGVRGTLATGTGFAAPRIIAPTPYATGVVAAAAGATGAVVAWIEGTARERVRAANWR